MTGATSVTGRTNAALPVDELGREVRRRRSRCRRARVRRCPRASSRSTSPPESVITEPVLGGAVDRRVPVRRRPAGSPPASAVISNEPSPVGLDRDPRCHDRTVDRHGALGADVEAGACRACCSATRRSSSAAAVEVTAGTSTGAASISTRVSIRRPERPAARGARPRRRRRCPGTSGVAAKARGRGVEGDRGVDGLDEQLGRGLAEGRGRGLRVDAHGGARGIGEPRR